MALAVLGVVYSLGGCPDRSAQQGPGDGRGASGPEMPSDPVPTPSTEQAPAASEPQPARQFALCRGEQAPTLQWLTGGDRDLLGVHCGERVRLLWAPASDPTPSLFEALALEFEPARPDGVARPGTLAWADVDADGHPDLVVGFPVVNKRDSPVGGTLFVLAGQGAPNRALGPPLRWLNAHPLALATAPVENPQREDLLILHGEDPRLSRPNELWQIPPGIAPERSETTRLTRGAKALLAPDLDGDGLADPSVLDAQGSLQVLWSAPFNAKAPLDTKAPDAGAPDAGTGWPISGSQAMAVGDLNGDGRPDLVWLEGRRVRWAAAHGRDGGAKQEGRAGRRPQPDTLQDVTCAADGCGDTLALVDADADGRPDLLTYQHPEVVLYRQVRAGHFDRQVLAVPVGEGIAVMAVGLRNLGGDAQPELWLLCQREATGTFSLAVAAYSDPPPRIDLTAEPQTIPPLPLRPQPPLP